MKGQTHGRTGRNERNDQQKSKLYLKQNNFMTLKVVIKHLIKSHYSLRSLFFVLFT